MFYVVQYTKSGKFLAVISGMGRNKGTCDAGFKSKRTAQRHARSCRRDDPKNIYKVEE